MIYSCQANGIAHAQLPLHSADRLGARPAGADLLFLASPPSLSDAEDLAQETLATVWSRDDYEFEKEEDFFRVCYGFARLVLQKGHRESQKHAGDELDPATAAAARDIGGVIGTEARILLAQVCEVGASQLQEKEWQLIQQGAISDRATIGNDLNMGDANNVRVRLHRARKKLARLTGWRKNRM
jgi:DNA-directed RNA polymerase specialized sigma24 family protein